MKKLKIKPYNRTWYGMLVLQLVIVGIITFATRNLERPQLLNVLRVFNTCEGIYLFFYKFGLSKDKNYDFNIWDDLPFYLCNLGTIMAIIASFVDNRYFMGFCYGFSIMGAVMAYVYPSEGFFDIPMISVRAIGYYGYHGLLICTGFLFVTTGVYVPEYKDIIPIVLILIGILCIVHVINTIIRKTVFPECNYSFTYGARGNAVLQKVYDLIPINLVYMLAITPLFGVFSLVVFFITRLFL